MRFFRTPKPSQPTSSFSITVKLDTQESARRLSHCRTRIHQLSYIRKILLPLDPDRKVWLTFDELAKDALAAAEDLSCHYVGERSYMAEGVMAVEAVVREAEVLVQRLCRGYRERWLPTGFSLRLAGLVERVHKAWEVLEDMRTKVMKEMAGFEEGEKQEGGKRRRGGSRKDGKGDRARQMDVFVSSLRRKGCATGCKCFSASRAYYL